VFVSVGSVNCNIFNCDDGDCGKKCRIVKGRDQVEITVNSGVVYGHIKDSAGEVFETDLKKGVTYYLFTTIDSGAKHHVSDTTLTLLSADGKTILAKNDDGPLGRQNSYIKYKATANIDDAIIQVRGKSRQDRGKAPCPTWRKTRVYAVGSGLIALCIAG
jgi:hypothetical protein